MLENPHYPSVSGSWSAPHVDNCHNRLFRTPTDPLDYSDVEGSKPKSYYSSPVRSTDRIIPNLSLTKSIFKQPREIFPVIPNTTRRINGAHNREPSPAKPRPFYRTVRENTKAFDVSHPRIDLSKPSHKPSGIQSPIEGPRRKLFQTPMEYEFTVDSPRKYFDSDKPPRVKEQIDENPRRKLFQIPRKQFDPSEINEPKRVYKTRDIFGVVEDDSRKLFKEPREIFSVMPSANKLNIVTETNTVIESPRRKLFETPRDVIKYQDLEGSKPRVYYHAKPTGMPISQLPF